MDLNVGKEFAALRRMTVNELRAKYAEVFGEETNARHKQWLERRIIWRMQALAEGDISERARQRAAELARDADLRTSAPKATKPATTNSRPAATTTLRFSPDERLPMPGAVVTRQYKGQTLEVRVLPHGFEFAMVTDRQVRALWARLAASCTLACAAMKANMDETTARRYRRTRRLPSESAVAHTWRTRPDPFADVWPQVVAQLVRAPGLQAKTLFEWLQREYPGRFADGQLRTLERRVKAWRATAGPAKEVFFSQVHRPGELLSSDFTHMGDLGVTIAGQPFDHLVYHAVLTYSNWESATVCFSESLEALSDGLQHALWELQGVPQRHRTDRLAYDALREQRPRRAVRDYLQLLFLAVRESEAAVDAALRSLLDASAAITLDAGHCALAQELIRSGRKLWFTTCSLLVQELLIAKRDLKLKRVLKRLARYDALVIDDLGYVQQSREEMEVLFTLLAERYERGSVNVNRRPQFNGYRPTPPVLCRPHVLCPAYQAHRLLRPVTVRIGVWNAFWIALSA